MSEIDNTIKDIEFKQKQANEKFNIEKAIARMLKNRQKMEMEDRKQSLEAGEGLPMVGNSIIDKGAEQIVEDGAENLPLIG